MGSDSTANLEGRRSFRDKIHSPPAGWRDYNLTIVALGDSVTQGLTNNPRMLGEEAYHAVLRQELARRFPERAFSTVNAGVGGDTTAGALKRLQHDVLDHHPDLVTLCFGLNDSGQGDAGLETFGQNLTELVQRIRKEGADVVLLTPNGMATHPNPNVDPSYVQHLPAFIERQTGGHFDRYVEIIRTVAKDTGVPLADAYAEWQRRETEGEDMTAHLANGLNHPDAYGHRIFADCLLDTILG